MEVKIKLDKRLYKRISEYCTVNSFVLEEYLSEIIEKQFNIDCYGDINDILHKTEDKQINSYNVSLGNVGTVQENEVKTKKRIIKSK